MGHYISFHVRDATMVVSQNSKQIGDPNKKLYCPTTVAIAIDQVVISSFRCKGEMQKL